MINNIFYQNVSNNSLYILAIEIWESPNWVINDNLYYSPGSNTYLIKWHNGSSNQYYSTLTSYYGSEGYEDDGDVGDPNFVSNNPETAEDFIPKHSCTELVIGVGTILNDKFTTDYCNPSCDRGSSIWNRGAFEDVTGPLCKANDDKFINFSLQQNYPNPFNPVTKIKYSIPIDGNVSLVIYDALGREVMKLFEGKKSKGEYSVDFDASNLVTGVYLYRLIANDFIQTKKMILLK